MSANITAENFREKLNAFLHPKTRNQNSYNEIVGILNSLEIKFPENNIAAKAQALKTQLGLFWKAVLANKIKPLSISEKELKRFLDEKILKLSSELQRLLKEQEQNERLEQERKVEKGEKKEKESESILDKRKKEPSSSRHVPTFTAKLRVRQPKPNSTLTSSISEPEPFHFLSKPHGATEPTSTPKLEVKSEPTPTPKPSLSNRESSCSQSEFKDFLDAQAKEENGYETAKKELEAGKKESHWMWYIFPQIVGLGESEQSKRYAIQSLQQACLYLENPILFDRYSVLVEIVKKRLDTGKSLLSLFGRPDDKKFISSITLFELALEELLEHEDRSSENFEKYTTVLENISAIFNRKDFWNNPLRKRCENTLLFTGKRHMTEDEIEEMILGGKYGFQGLSLLPGIGEGSLEDPKELAKKIKETEEDIKKRKEMLEEIERTRKKVEEAPIVPVPVPALIQPAPDLHPKEDALEEEKKEETEKDKEKAEKDEVIIVKKEKEKEKEKEDSKESAGGYYKEGKKHQKERRYVEAIAAYEKAVERNHTKARTNLGAMYWERNSGEDRHKAYDLWLQSIKEGDLRALAYLCEILEKEKEKEKEKKKQECIEKALEALSSKLASMIADINETMKQLNKTQDEHEREPLYAKLTTQLKQIIRFYKEIQKNTNLTQAQKQQFAQDYFSQVKRPKGMKLQSRYVKEQLEELKGILQNLRPISIPHKAESSGSGSTVTSNSALSPVSSESSPIVPGGAGSPTKSPSLLDSFLSRASRSIRHLRRRAVGTRSAPTLRTVPAIPKISEKESQSLQKRDYRIIGPQSFKESADNIIRSLHLVYELNVREYFGELVKFKEELREARFREEDKAKISAIEKKIKEQETLLEKTSKDAALIERDAKELSQDIDTYLKSSEGKIKTKIEKDLLAIQLNMKAIPEKLKLIYRREELGSVRNNLFSRIRVLQATIKHLANAEENYEKLAACHEELKKLQEEYEQAIDKHYQITKACLDKLRQDRIALSLDLSDIDKALHELEEYNQKFKLSVDRIKQKNQECYVRYVLPKKKGESEGDEGIILEKEDSIDDRIASLKREIFALQEKMESINPEVEPEAEKETAEELRAKIKELAQIYYKEGQQHQKAGRQKEAIAAYEEAVKRNHTKARINLGAMYLQGQGCDVDIETASALWEKSAEEGDLRALEYLCKILGPTEDKQKHIEKALNVLSEKLASIIADINETMKQLNKTQDEHERAPLYAKLTTQLKQIIRFYKEIQKNTDLTQAQKQQFAQDYFSQVKRPKRMKLQSRYVKEQLEELKGILRNLRPTSIPPKAESSEPIVTLTLEISPGKKDTAEFLGDLDLEQVETELEELTDNPETPLLSEEKSQTNTDLFSSFREWSSRRVVSIEETPKPKTIEEIIREDAETFFAQNNASSLAVVCIKESEKVFSFYVVQKDMSYESLLTYIKKQSELLRSGTTKEKSEALERINRVLSLAMQDSRYEVSYQYGGVAHEVEIELKKAGYFKLKKVDKSLLQSVSSVRQRKESRSVSRDPTENITVFIPQLPSDALRRVLLAQVYEKDSNPENSQKAQKVLEARKTGDAVDTDIAAHVDSLRFIRGRDQYKGHTITQTGGSIKLTEKEVKVIDEAEVELVSNILFDVSSEKVTRVDIRASKSKSEEAVRLAAEELKPAGVVSMSIKVEKGKPGSDGKYINEAEREKIHIANLLEKDVVGVLCRYDDENEKTALWRTYRHLCITTADGSEAKPLHQRYLAKILSDKTGQLKKELIEGMFIMHEKLRIQGKSQDELLAKEYDHLEPILRLQAHQSQNVFGRFFHSAFTRELDVLQLSPIPTNA